MTSSPGESATARPAGVGRAPVPRAGATDPTGAVAPRAVTRAGGTPVQAAAQAAALVGRVSAAVGVTQRPGREDTRPAEGVTAAPGRPELRKSEVAPA